MKFPLQMLRQRGTWLVLLALGLAATAPSVVAAPTQQASSSTTGLHVTVTPRANSSVLRVRYESTRYGSVRIELRDERGRLLYSDILRRSRFAGDFDLAAYPAGGYSLTLSTPAERHTQHVRLTRHAPVVATLVLPVAPRLEASPL